MPTGNERWAYRTDLTSGQRCWFLLPARHQARATAETSPVNCLASPKGPAPKGSQWRYRIQRKGGLKCWHLVRKGNVDTGFPPSLMKSNADASSRVAAAQAMLPTPKDSPSQSEASSSRKGASPPSEPDQPGLETFHSRWSAALDIPPASTAAIVAPAGSLDVAEMSQTSDGTAKGPPAVHAQREESAAHKILVVTLSSSAVLLVLYALIGGALDGIRRVRGRQARKSLPFARPATLGPPTAPGISDILARLRLEDVDDERTRRRHERADEDGSKTHHVG
jgi:hypothetical protein